MTPNTWNIIGLDSNTPAFGPNRFPVGAKVCGGTPGQNVPVSFTWDTVNPYVYLRSGSAGALDGPPLTITLGADGCADAYFEVEVDRTAAAFDTTRQYHISAGGASTPTPRELYVEHLISQSRNAISTVKLDGVSIPAGGAMNLFVGNTYTIDLYGGTATQGYNQFEAFINFPNTIFQILSVSTTYSADDSPYVSNPHDQLYADACGWESDPFSPNYLSCVGGDYKAGGSNVVTTYIVKILGGGGTTQTLNTLLYDFSGSSFHYNADFSTGARFANIIDPATVTISKNFAPDPTNVGGVSALTFTLTNPNPAAVSGLNFTDVFPTSPGPMMVATPPNATTNGCGTPTFAPGGGDTSISFANGVIAANSSCTIKVNVTPPTTGAYTNTSNHLFIGTLDTGKFASDTLTVNNAPPPPAPVCGLTMASWTVPAGSPNPPLPTTQAPDVITASASAFVPADTQIGTSGQGDSGAWNTYGYKSDGQYLDFAVDTSKYQSVFLSFYVANPSPANGPTSLVVSYNNGAGFTNIYTITNPALAFTLHTIDFTGLTSTTGNTTFRLTATGAKNNASGASLNFDNITLNGCAIPNPPTMTKNFSPNPIAVDATSTLGFTVTNPNAGVPLSGVAFTDTLPAGLTVADGSSVQCGGTLTSTAPSTLSFTGGTFAAGASCVIAATVTATTAGPHDNVSGFVSSTESGANTGSTGVAAASLTAVSPPSIAKRFAPNPILAGGISTLTFTITNPNQNEPLSGVAFSDTFPVAPGAMTVAGTPNVTTSGCGAGAFSPALAGGEAIINFTGATVAAGGTCAVTVDVTAPVTGTYNNTSGYVSHLINAATVTGNAAADTLAANPASPAIALLKQVGPSATGPWTSFLAVTTGADVYYKFTVENAGDAPLSPVSVTDPLVSTASCSWPASLPVAVAANDDHLATCIVGPVTAVVGSHLNTATASGTFSGTSYTDDASARYATTGLTLAKTAAEANFKAAGDVLNYSYGVANTGFAPLVGPATVADDKATVTCPALSSAIVTATGLAGDGDNYLDPGEQITCNAPYTVLAADVTAKLVTNTASATIAGVTSPPANLTVALAPDLAAVKTNNVAGEVPLGNTFDWTLTVSNATAAGAASFADAQILLLDDLPASGATYTVGAVTKAGATGTIECTIAADTLACAAKAGAVTIPASLQGTASATNGSAVVTGTGTAFTTQLAAGSIIDLAGIACTVASIQSDTDLALTAPYAGVTASGLTIPGSFSVPVTVTTTAGGPLVNPRSGGACQADPGAAIPEIDETNNGCADTVTVRDLPSLLVVKSVQAYSDPINGTGPSAKAIPGALMLYTILVTNTGPGTVDDNTTVITDPIPANTELFVGDINGAGSGPVLFADGATPSGLCYDYANPLPCVGDTIEFSNTPQPGPYVYGYIPTADANGCDPNVTSLRITFGGPFDGASGGNNPSFDVKFRVRVK